MPEREAAKTLKPWPSDAVLIVCALAGQENRAGMDSVHTAECRDCGRPV